MTLIEKTNVQELKNQLKRVFALPICRSTMREIQNAIGAAIQTNQEQGNTLFEALLTGQFNKAAFSKDAERLMEEVIESFSVQCRLSKEIFERGDFISIITCDTLTQKNQAIFLNRLRKIDGDEFQFVVDPQGTVFLVHHFLSRLEEFQRLDPSKNQLDPFRQEMSNLRDRLDRLIQVPARSEK